MYESPGINTNYDVRYAAGVVQNLLPEGVEHCDLFMKTLVLQRASNYDPSLWLCVQRINHFAVRYPPIINIHLRVVISYVGHCEYDRKMCNFLLIYTIITDYECLLFGMSHSSEHSTSTPLIDIYTSSNLTFPSTPFTISKYSLSKSNNKIIGCKNLMCKCIYNSQGNFIT